MTKISDCVGCYPYMIPEVFRPGEGHLDVNFKDLLMEDAEGKRHKLPGSGVRVYLDGRDVTEDTFACNVRHGWVAVYARNARGQRFLCPSFPGWARDGANYDAHPRSFLKRGEVKIVFPNGGHLIDLAA